MKNLQYKTDKISNYFSENRIKWDEFYPSERELFQSIDLFPNDKVLDIGCGCGGLGLALAEKFDISCYTGIDINSAAVAVGKKLNPKATLIEGDILEISETNLKNKYFDLVCSLSCIDWNIQFKEMLLAAWQRVKPGGKFVATFRLSVGKGCDDIKLSYQYIDYEGKKIGELAPYVVLNFENLMTDLQSFNPAEIKAFGYWGKPSVTAVTPYKSLCFVAYSIKKRQQFDHTPTQVDLNLPKEFNKVLER